jgi:hypothetical protein
MGKILLAHVSECIALLKAELWGKQLTKITDISASKGKIIKPAVYFGESEPMFRRNIFF